MSKKFAMKYGNVMSNSDNRAIMAHCDKVKRARVSGRWRLVAVRQADIIAPN
ncbi:hypothetical protein [Pseudohongiella acticola]|jgi:hypothetical protein|uniref:hypothetical protein n=1 Tax=Pseudohongiella acticola TaxID=1524254 RepID=UPI001471A428|nr:hypothetical protein [Pseudohongiella acticola]|tara:strand:+ start:733 stop:888 length:156 start_codon:yes stop_codon:yes gene_type:complete